MSTHAVAQINALARHLVTLRPQPRCDIHLVRGRRVQAWIALVDAAPTPRLNWDAGLAR